MSAARQDGIYSPRVQRAIHELQQTITSKYPTASFAVGPAEDDPRTIHITATVDIDDPDEVGDLVLDRVLELQLDEGIPIHVIPVRTRARVLAELSAEQAVGVRRPRRTISLFGPLPR